MTGVHDRLLTELLSFVEDEKEAGHRKLFEVWNRAVEEKRQQGWTQRFLRLERGEEPSTLWAYPDPEESRFREGDLLVLHEGSPFEGLLGRGFSLEFEQEDRWLLRGNKTKDLLEIYKGGLCFADPDGMDLTPFYKSALQDISASYIGRKIILPLLSGELDVGFDNPAYDQGQQAARAQGFNAKQAEAVGLAHGALYLACVQGPPGTGKSSVLALIARLATERGERVLMTSHTHMAINNALNKIHREGVPVAKIGAVTQRKGLDAIVPCHPNFTAWQDRPSDGYVIGATPFATCTSRLENCEFDTVLFDEASQITVPLALMAMRKAKRFIFIGDQQQLPPVTLSRSVLSKDSASVFARLTSERADHTVMLTETYRMNRWLTAWPSQTYYGNALQAAGANRDRCLSLRSTPSRFEEVFSPDASGVFIPTLDSTAKAHNPSDAELVVDLCTAAVEGGLKPGEIGIVTPYRSQGRAVRGLLLRRLGGAAAREVVADTVERMQGQERELVILSLATGDELFLSAVAEFFFQPQRLNVSITRPKTKLIVIGPELKSVPEVEHAELRKWMADYIDFISQLKRVPL